MRITPFVLAASIAIGSQQTHAAIDPKTFVSPVAADGISARISYLLSEGFKAPGASWTLVKNNSGRLAVRFVEVTEDGKCRIDLAAVPNSVGAQNIALPPPKVFLSTDVPSGASTSLQGNGRLPAVVVYCEDGLAKTVIDRPDSQTPQSNAD